MDSIEQALRKIDDYCTQAQLSDDERVSIDTVLHGLRAAVREDIIDADAVADIVATLEDDEPPTLEQRVRLLLESLPVPPKS